MSTIINLRIDVKWQSTSKKMSTKIKLGYYCNVKWQGQGRANDRLGFMLHPTPTLLDFDINEHDKKLCRYDYNDINKLSVNVKINMNFHTKKTKLRPKIVTKYLNFCI